MPIPSIHPYVPTCHSQSGCPANQSDILSLSDVNECAYASSYGELLHLSPQNKPFSMQSSEIEMKLLREIRVLCSVSSVSLFRFSHARLYFTVTFNNSEIVKCSEFQDTTHSFFLANSFPQGSLKLIIFEVYKAGPGFKKSQKGSRFFMHNLSKEHTLFCISFSLTAQNQLHELAPVDSGTLLRLNFVFVV